jgi:hypothetical protein
MTQSCDDYPTNPNCTCKAPGVPVEFPPNFYGPQDPDVSIWICCGGPNSDPSCLKNKNFKINSEQETYLNARKNAESEMQGLENEVSKSFAGHCFSDYSSSTGISKVWCNGNKYPRTLTFKDPYQSLSSCYCVPDENVWPEDESIPTWFSDNVIKTSLPIDCIDGNRTHCQTIATQKNGVVTAHKATSETEKHIKEIIDSRVHQEIYPEDYPDYYQENLPEIHVEEHPEKQQVTQKKSDTILIIGVVVTIVILMIIAFIIFRNRKST